eukprot:tig00001000_g6163.t1
MPSLAIGPLDPARALRRYLAHFSPVERGQEVPLFAKAWGAGEALSYTYINVLPKRIASSLGLDAGDYSSLSFRHTGPTWAALGGTPKRLLDTHGRWSRLHRSAASEAYVMMRPPSSKARPAPSWSIRGGGGGAERPLLPPGGFAPDPEQPYTVFELQAHGHAKAHAPDGGRGGAGAVGAAALLEEQIARYTAAAESQVAELNARLDAVHARAAAATAAAAAGPAAGRAEGRARPSRGAWRPPRRSLGPSRAGGRRRRRRRPAGPAVPSWTPPAASAAPVPVRVAAVRSASSDSLVRVSYDSVGSGGGGGGGPRFLSPSTGALSRRWGPALFATWERAARLTRAPAGAPPRGVPRTIVAPRAAPATASRRRPPRLCPRPRRRRGTPAPPPPPPESTPASSYSGTTASLGSASASASNGGPCAAAPPPASRHWGSPPSAPPRGGGRARAAAAAYEAALASARRAAANGAGAGDSWASASASMEDDPEASRDEMRRGLAAQYLAASGRPRRSRGPGAPEGLPGLSAKPTVAPPASPTPSTPRSRASGPPSASASGKTTPRALFRVDRGRSLDGPLAPAPAAPAYPSTPGLPAPSARWINSAS